MSDDSTDTEYRLSFIKPLYPHDTVYMIHHCPGKIKIFYKKFTFLSRVRNPVRYFLNKRHKVKHMGAIRSAKDRLHPACIPRQTGWLARLMIRICFL